MLADMLSIVPADPHASAGRPAGLLYNRALAGACSSVDRADGFGPSGRGFESCRARRLPCGRRLEIAPPANDSTTPGRVGSYIAKALASGRVNECAGPIGSSRLRPRLPAAPLQLGLNAAFMSATRKTRIGTSPSTWSARRTTGGESDRATIATRVPMRVDGEDELRTQDVGEMAHVRRRRRGSACRCSRAVRTATARCNDRPGRAHLLPRDRTATADRLGPDDTTAGRRRGRPAATRAGA